MPRGTEIDGSAEETGADALGVAPTDAPLEDVDADTYEPAEGESASETAKNIAALLTADGEPGAEGSEGTAAEAGEARQPGDSSEVATQGRQRGADGKFVKGAQQQTAGDPTLTPPARLTAEQKQAFQNLPEGLKRETNRMFADYERQFTQTQQRYAAVAKATEQMGNMAENYIRDNNLIDTQGRVYTKERFVSELISAHHNIIQDPDRHLAQMIQSTGANVDNINAYLSGQSPGGADVTKHPQFRAIQNELGEIKRSLTGREQAETQARIAPISSEFEGVMREVDATTGELRYPWLQDDGFLESTKPVVAALKRTDPYLSHGDALRKAYAVLTGQEYSPGTQSAPLHARPDNLYKQRSRNAAVSVRGRIAPLGSGGPQDVDNLDIGDIPQSATETARMISRMLSGG